MEGLNEFEKTLIRIETKVDAILKVKNDHEARIRSLEIYRWILVGGFSVVAFVIGLLFAK